MRLEAARSKGFESFDPLESPLRKTSLGFARVDA
jgi:hypothetical protein